MANNKKKLIKKKSSVFFLQIKDFLTNENFEMY